MKIMTILGTRPEIIRLSRIIPKLDQNCNHILIHTGQNYDYNLNQLFFKELGLRQPDYLLQCQADTIMKEIGLILAEGERVILETRPDRLLILGDTNSALSAIIAKRYQIPVFHMEAGNRCYDDRVPEEINRRLVDHCSDILLPYTENSRFNLLKEGLPQRRIYVTGNPIAEVINFYQSQIKASQILTKLDLRPKHFFLVTLHRAENVDIAGRLADFITALQLIYKKYQLPVVCSLHPRTRAQLQKSSQSLDHEGFIVAQPFGFFDFITLEQNAFCVLSDSGTVQEECCIFQIPCLTLRDVTERPETIESGSNLLTGSQPDSILDAVNFAVHQTANWLPPREYTYETVSETVVKILLSKIPL